MCNIGSVVRRFSAKLTAGSAFDYQTRFLPYTVYMLITVHVGQCIAHCRIRRETRNMFDSFGRLEVKPRLGLQNVETTLVTIEADRCDVHELCFFWIHTFILLSQHTELSH
jgi:hypothetical protein